MTPTALDGLWVVLWEDLRHNATGRPSGLVIIGEHRAAIEAEAAHAALTALRERVAGLPDDCHSPSGLRCYRDDQGRCSSIDRAAVLALINKALEVTP